MAISKIQLGNGGPQELRDAKSLHYIGHADSGITPDQSGVYHSAASINTGSSVTVQKYDYVTLGTDNINLVCVDTTGSGDTACTWAKLTEKAAEIPVQVVQVNGTALTPGSDHAVNIPAATSSTADSAAFGVVETGANITNSNGVISVADAAVGTKGVVSLSISIPASGADNTTVPTTLAVKNAIDNLPEPMVFKGTVGTGGTVDWTAEDPDDALPSASGETVGYTYKVITAHDTTPACEVGDTIICADPQGDGTYEWVVVPSGDEPSGTVTSVGVAAGANSNLTIATGIGDGDDPITASGTITVGVAAEHTIPADSAIANWDAAYAKVNPYTENTDIVTGLATAATQESSDGSVLIARVGGTSNDTLFIDYIKPTIDTTKKAVAKANP